MKLYLVIAVSGRARMHEIRDLLAGDGVKDPVLLYEFDDDAEKTMWYLYDARFSGTVPRGFSTRSLKVRPPSSGEVMRDDLMHLQAERERILGVFCGHEDEEGGVVLVTGVCWGRVFGGKDTEGRTVSWPAGSVYCYDTSAGTLRFVGSAADPI